MTALTNSRAAHWLPDLVERSVSSCVNQRMTALLQRPNTIAEQVTRAGRLARIYERESRWWCVLALWADSSGPVNEVPSLLGHAAICAMDSCEHGAQFWSGIAADMASAAAGGDVCLVVGCGCGGTCGVAS
jgi:hypothetical protein